VRDFLTEAKAAFARRVTKPGPQSPRILGLQAPTANDINDRIRPYGYTPVNRTDSYSMSTVPSVQCRTFETDRPMSISELQYLVVDALEDVKAQDIRVFDTGPQRNAKSAALSDLFDRVVVATATSNRQTRALAAHVQDRAREAGYPVVSVEGEETGEWVLVDLGDIVVHIMQPAIRAYYNLEELWGTHPIELPLPRPSTHKGHARKDEDAAPQGAQA